MAQYNEFPENQPQDKPDIKIGKIEISPASSWNEQASRRSDRSLSPEEQAERMKVESLQGSIGRAFDRVPSEQNIREWYDKLNPAEKKALNNPNSEIVLTSTASRTGDAGYNERLSKRSAEIVKQFLQEKLGVKANIKIEALGYDKSKPEGDDRFDRQVHVDIIPPEKAQKVETVEPSPETIKDLTELPKKPKDYDFDKEVNDRLKDVPDIIKGEMAKSILTEIGKLAKTYLEGVGELKQANKRAAELTGIENAIQMSTQDWVHGRGPHIQEGKPYTAEELKGRLKPLEARDMHNDMKTLKVMNLAGDQDLNRGFQIAADALNQILSHENTPETRRKALQTFAKTILPKIARNRQQRFAEIRGKK